MAQQFPAQATIVTDTLHGRLGDALVAVYLYGSHVAGGPKPASDLDLLAVLRRPLTDDERAWAMSTLLGLSSPPGSAGRRALEVTCVVLSEIVPWRHPAMRELQFGEWLRAALQAGNAAPRESDPDLALLVTQARANGIALFGPDAADVLPAVPARDVRAAILTMLPEVARHLEGEETHALLTLARMWVTLQTGDIVSKDAAVSIVGPRLPPEPRAVLERARSVYRGATVDDWQGWTDRVAACVADMQGGLAPWTRAPQAADGRADSEVAPLRPD